MNNIAPEDRDIFRKIMEARRSGDTETAIRLEEELKKKYPDKKFGGGRRSGSGSAMSGSTAPVPVQNQ